MKLFMTLGFSFLFILSISTKLQKNFKPSLSSYDYGVKDSLVRKRQNPPIVLTTGAPTEQGSNGTLPVRREIRELEKDQDMWTLYILALDLLQHLDQNDMSSYYRISGIHGRPFESYDGVDATPGNQNNGYCTHVSILFPTWHRPYLALYEQILYELIQEIVEQYPAGTTRDTYYAAAQNFRIPYWDWAAYRPDGENILPQSIVGSPSVNVNGPRGRQLIANPLFTYKFQPLNPSKFPNIPFNEFPETLRYPDKNDSSAISQDNIATQNIEISAISIRSRIYTILTNYHNYLAFSNEGYRLDSSPSEQDSLEAIHDQMHAIIGGGGHMSYIDYAGFDPIFYLHHAMVDRCFALWQVLNPNSYVIPRISISSTFTTSVGQIQDSKTPLTPFFKDNSGNFWNSDDVRDTKDLGYSYPETSGFTGDDKRQDVIMAINRLYGPAGDRMPKRDLNAQSISASGEYREWVVNIKMQKSAMNEPFSVYIFLGPFNDDPMCWAFDPNFAGLHTTFVRYMSLDETNQHSSSQIVAASIPLTNSLIKKMKDGELESLNIKDVSSWLADNLSYRMSLLGGKEIFVEDVPDLEISIASAEVSLPENHIDLPVWGKMMQQVKVNLE